MKNTTTKTFRIRTAPRRLVDRELVLLAALAGVAAPIFALAVRLVLA